MALNISTGNHRPHRAETECKENNIKFLAEKKVEE